MNIIAKILIGLIVILLAYTGIYAYSLNRVSVTDISANAIEDVRLRGYTVSGELLAINRGILPVKINRIEYEVRLDDGETIAQGTAPEATLRPGEETAIPLSTELKWRPSTQVILSMIRQENIKGELTGNIYLSFLGVSEIAVPIEQEIDLDSYVRQFARDQLDELLNQITQ